MTTQEQEYILGDDDSVVISSARCRSLAGIKYNREVLCTIVAIISPDRLTIRFKNPYDSNRESTRSFNQVGHCLYVTSRRPSAVYLKAPTYPSRVPLILGARFTA